MAGSVNKWIGIGNLGADVEVKYTPAGKPVANLSLACNEVWKDKGGQKQERVEWVKVQVWGDQAENCGKYLSKGRSIYVEGRLQTRSYDKDGIKRYVTEVVAERVVFLGGGNGEGGARGGSGGGGGGGRSSGGGRSGWGDEPAAAPAPGGDGGPPPSDDDIPF